MGLRALALALALLALLALGLWLRAGGERRRSAAPALATAALPRELAGPSAAPAPLPARAREPTAPTAGTAHARGMPMLSPAETGALASLRIRVRDEAGEPAGPCALRVTNEAGPHAPMLAPAERHAPLRTAETDQAGRAELVGLEPGPWAVRATHADGRVGRKSVFLGAGENACVLELADPPRPLVVRVRAGAKPVPGARVELAGIVVDANGPRRVGGDVPTLVATSDEYGQAHFPLENMQSGVIAARSAEGLCGFTTLQSRRSSSHPLEVHIAPAGTLTGRLVGLPAEELAAARLRLRAESSPHPHHTSHGIEHELRVDAEARFDFAGLAAGTYGLRLVDPRGAKLVLPPLTFGTDVLPNSVQPATVTIQSGETTTLELAVERGALLTGTVRDAEGAPLAGIVVRATYAPETSNFPDGFELFGVNVWRFDSDARVAGDHPVTHPRTTSDAEGYWRLAGLEAGRHRLELFLAGASHVRENVTLAAGETRTLEQRLVPAGAIQGLDRDGGYLGLVLDGRPCALAIVPRSGGFSFVGLVPDEYELAIFHSDTSIPWVPLTRVTVEAGRTTWVDLRALARPIGILARVLSEGVPLAGVRVESDSQARRTDARGECRFDEDFPSSVVRLGVRDGGTLCRFELAASGEPASGFEVTLALGQHALEVECQDSLGQPAPARLRLQASDLEAPPGLTGVELDGGHVDASGRIRLTHLFAGSYALEAELQGATLARTLVLPSDGPLVLRAPPVAALEIEVLGPAGKPFARGTVHVAALDAELRGLAAEGRTFPVGPGGRVTLEQFPAGPTALRLRSNARGRRDEEWASEELVLMPGERRTITLRVRAPARAR